MGKKLNYKELNKSLDNDPLNLDGFRNRYNMTRKYYNCGGFALGVYSWVRPYLYDNDDEANIESEYTFSERECIIQSCYKHKMSTFEVEKEILKYDVQFLLKTYPFLYQTTLEQCKKKDVVIAYRLFINEDYDDDFHFKVRINGKWFEKCGVDKIKPCKLNSQIPWKYNKGDLCYDSPIVYFVKRG